VCNWEQRLFSAYPHSRVQNLKGKIMTPYTLPDLPYDYSALEPYISGKIMELHHGKHHAAYVKNANHERLSL
jgi:hypothetical protein